LLDEVAAWLVDVGFRLWDIGGEYRNDQGILTALDCVFVNTRSAVTPDWYHASPLECRLTRARSGC
jgi:hypothetical protein